MTTRENENRIFRGKIKQVELSIVQADIDCDHGLQVARGEEGTSFFGRHLLAVFYRAGLRLLVYMLATYSVDEAHGAVKKGGRGEAPRIFIGLMNKERHCPGSGLFTTLH